MGFCVYLPFLLVDIVVSTVLMSMGMMMMPPVIISTPFKVLLFVLADGWHLIASPSIAVSIDEDCVMSEFDAVTIGRDFLYYTTLLTLPSLESAVGRPDHQRVSGGHKHSRTDAELRTAIGVGQFVCRPDAVDVGDVGVLHDANARASGPIWTMTRHERDD